MGILEGILGSGTWEDTWEGAGTAAGSAGRTSLLVSALELWKSNTHVRLRNLGLSCPPSIYNYHRHTIFSISVVECLSSYMLIIVFGSFKNLHNSGKN